MNRYNRETSINPLNDCDRIGVPLDFEVYHEVEKGNAPVIPVTWISSCLAEKISSLARQGEWWNRDTDRSCLDRSQRSLRDPAYPLPLLAGR
jgi:hypothetical protein